MADMTRVSMSVRGAEVVTVPIDDTLTIEGQAADAKATGDALALKADKSELQAAVKVNNQPADAQGLILIDGRHIPVNNEDEETLAEAVTDLKGKTAENIPMNSDSGAKTIAEVVNANAEAIENMEEMTGATMPIESGSQTTVKAAIEARVKTVNQKTPDADGNVDLSVVPLAENLQSDKMQSVDGTFIIRTTGGSSSVSDGKAYPQHIMGTSERTGYVAEELNMTVIPIERTEPDEPITATIDRDVFVAYVDESGTINLYYTTEWSEDPELYGVTVEGTPVAGDQIKIVYVKEERGTIMVSNPGRLVGTGWNLFSYNNGYARVVKYSNEYGYKIGGTFTSIEFSETLEGNRVSILPGQNGLFQVPGDGYVFVNGGNATDTYILATWSDWTDGPATGYWEAYKESGIDLSAVMGTYFPYGMLSVGTIHDEIDLSAKRTISRVERMAYTAENLAAAIASGRDFTYDTNYIYLERAEYVISAITIDTVYNVSEHGLEWFTETNMPLITEILYGKNLRDKLERDVLTISQQTLAEEEKAQVRRNIGVMDPPTNGNGTLGQLLKTNGDGTTEWTNQGTPTDAQVGTAVSAWLEAHPEATTTVQDGAISRAKLNDDLKAKTDAVPEIKSALEKLGTGIDFCEEFEDGYIYTQIDASHPVSEAVDMTIMPSSSGYKTTVVECQPGDTFVLTGRGGNGPRLWCFTDSDGYRKNNSSWISSGNNRETIAVHKVPDGASKLIVNSNEPTFLAKFSVYDDDTYKRLQQALKSRINGKKVSIIGDSIDTFDQEGYRIDGYNMYYPAYDVTKVDQTWWMQVINQSGAELEINASWAGSFVTDYSSTAPSFYDRVSVLGSPDVIFVCLGVNDALHSQDISIGDYDFETEYTSLDESKFRPAYIKGIKGLQETYPNAKIFCIAKSMGFLYKDSIATIAKTLGAEYIDASDYVTPSAGAVHPGFIGMQQIASQILYPTDSGTWEKHYPMDAERTKTEIETIRKMFANSVGVEVVDSYTPSAYYNTQSSNVDLSVDPTHSDAGYRCAVIDCKEGDTFIVKGWGGNGPRLWCYVDANGDTFSAPDGKAGGNETRNYEVIPTAPAGAVKLVINSRDETFVAKIPWHLSELFTKAYQAKGVLPANADYNNYKSVGVYRKYANGDYPVVNGPNWIPADETQLLVVLRGNATGSDTAIIQLDITCEYGIAKRQCISNVWSNWERIDEAVKNKPVLCVSTFRDNAYTPVGSQPYFFALSYDGGRSFFEIKDSKEFAETNLESTDVQPFEWNDGLIMICTSNSASAPWDLKAVYTIDFNTYYDAKPDLGFMRKAAEYTDNPYVWAPQLFKKGNDYYVIASVSTGEPENGDLYNPESQNSKTRYLYPFARKVTFTFDGTDFDIVPDGELFQLQFENETESIMDVSLLYSSSQGKVYAAYKDRILNTINIASASDITGTFEDEETFVGDIPYSEACYLTTISKISYLYWCTYGLRTSAKRRYFYYSTNGVVNTSETEEYVGVVNSYRFVEGSAIDMRNPYPLEISDSLFNKLAGKYNLPASIPSYKRAEKQEYKESAILTRMSHVIYHELGKFVRIPDNYIIPISAKTGGSTGNMCDMCFKNPEYTAKIGGISGTTTIITPYDEQADPTTDPPTTVPSIITNETGKEKMYKVSYGYIHKGSKNIVEQNNEN